MRTGFKKWWPLSTLSILGMGLLSADVQTADDSGMTDVSVNPSARLVRKPGWFVTAEVLLWQAHEDGLAPAVSSKECTNPDLLPNENESIFTDSNLRHLDFDWDWGSRVGVGYNLCHDEWDIYLNWTYFQDEAHRHLDTAQTVKAKGCCNEVGQDLYATFSAVNPNTIKTIQVDTAEGSWNFILNMIDFELGRKFFVGKWLSLRPNIGVRNAWVHQHYHVRYSGGDFDDLGAGLDFEEFITTVPDQTDYISMRNNFWGIGPRFGLDTQWNLLREWSVFGDAAISILFGNFKVHQKERLGCMPILITETDSGIGSSTESFFVDNRILDINDSFHAIRMITDLILGVRWEHLFCRDKYKIMISLGWEHHLFLHQNQLKHYVSDSRNLETFSTAPAVNGYPTPAHIVGAATKTNIIPDSDKNLSTQGVTLAARFDF